MKDTIASTRCPKCGGPIPAEASQGICPRCALAAVATPTEAGQPPGERPPPPSPDAVAAAFPQFEILELVGAGGMGAVFKARQPKLDRFVALKLLSRPLAGDGTFAERFHREARVLARLNHPGIVSVYDYGEAGGFFYLLMEFVDGVNLRQAMQAGRFTPAQALALVPRICEALQFAHDEGILHRDIKPENILLDTRGRVKIADFGIAKLIGDKAKDATLTGSGLAVGTPHYMAPEQLEHPQDVDQRADIYSLGVVFYEMLTGELPIGRFAPPSQKTPMDPRVDEVVLRALEKERERRQHNATEVRTEVEQITATPAAQPSAPTPTAPTPKTSLCYVSTPEYMRTFWGRFIYIYQGNGELRLDEKTLSFTSGWQSVTIPLATIRSLALGEYSLAAKPIPLHFLEVTFDERGVPRTLLFTPIRSGFLPVWETNKIVAEWSSALQEALRAATGRTLALGRSSAKGRSHGELLKTFAVSAVLCSLAFAIIPIIAEHRLPNRWTDFVFGPVVAAVTLGMLVSLRAWRERVALRKKNLDELTGLPGSSAQVATGPSGTVVLPVLEADRRAPETSPAGLAGAARVAPCYFSTPERMRNCFPGPQAHIFQCKGELRLEGAELVFISPWQTRVVIPLKEVRDLSIGQFQMWTTPWVMKYGRFNFLSITFGAEDQQRTVHLTPVPEGTSSTEQANAAVATWFEAIRKAVADLTGTRPKTSTPAAVTFSAERPWNWKGLPLFAAFLVSGALLAWRATTPTSGRFIILLFAATLVLLIACVWFCHGFLSADRAIKRGEFDKITSEEPPNSTATPVNEPPPTLTGPSRLSWMAVGSAICSLPSWLLVVSLLISLFNSLGPDGLPPKDFTLGLFEMVALGTGGFVGLAALFLGKEALREIRLGAGRMRGARLAVIGVLGIPVGLLVKILPSVLASASRSLGWQPAAAQGEFFIGAVLVGIFLLAAWVALALHRWTRLGANAVTNDRSPGKSPHTPHERQGWWLIAGLVVIVVGLVLWKGGLTSAPQDLPLPTAVDQDVLHLLQVVPEPAETAARGLALYGWQCELPALHLAVFSFTIWSNGTPNLQAGLSGWLAAGAQGPWRTLVQWKLHDGAVLSPELGAQQRWDVTLGVHGANVWMPKSALPNAVATYRHAAVGLAPSERVSIPSLWLVQGGGYQPDAAQQPDGAFTIEARIEPVLPHLQRALQNATGTAGGGTNWMEVLAVNPANR